jgi:site-specific DNA recombinase
MAQMAQKMRQMTQKSTISYNPVIGGQSKLTKTKRASIYIRCSSDEAKKEGYSPENQEEKLKEFAENNEWKLDKKHIYKDIGYSGGTDKRPDFQRLLIDARNKEFDIVVVYRLDRFFRNLRLLLNTLEELKELGIDFKSATESFDTSTLSGEVTLDVLGMAADLVRKITMGSQRDGVIKALEDGKWVTGGPIPYGWKLNKKTHKLEIHKKETKIVRMIFEWVAYEKLSKYKVQQKLNELKVPTKYDSSKKTKLKKVNGSGWWHVRTIDRILKRKAYYTGEYECERNGKNFIIKVPPIISKELYEIAQEQLRKNQKTSPRNVKRTYAFRHKLYCGIDGWKYYAFYDKPKKPTQKGRTFYRCSGKNRYIHATLCPSEEISENRILPPVWEKLKELFTNPEVTMEEFRKYCWEKSKRKAVEEKVAKINNVIQSIQKEQERIKKLYQKGCMTEEEFDKEWSECKEREVSYQREKEKFSQFFVREEEKKSRIASIHELYNKLKNAIENATYETKCQIIDKIIDRIIVKGRELEIECNLPTLPQETSARPIKNAPKFYSDTRGIN